MRPSARQSTRACALLFVLLVTGHAAPAAEFVFPGQSLAPGEVDFFDFEVDAVGFVALATFELGAGADTILSLLDDEPDLLAFDDDPLEPDSTLVRLLSPGSYTAAISGAPNAWLFESATSAAGEYSFVVFGSGVVSASFAGSTIVPVPPSAWLLTAALLALGARAGPRP